MTTGQPVSRLNEPQDHQQDMSPWGAAVTTRGPATAHHLPQEKGRPVWES